MKTKQTTAKAHPENTPKKTAKRWTGDKLEIDDFVIQLPDISMADIEYKPMTEKELKAEIKRLKEFLA